MSTIPESHEIIAFKARIKYFEQENKALRDRIAHYDATCSNQDRIIRELKAKLDASHYPSWYEGVRIEAGYMEQTECVPEKNVAAWYWKLGYIAGECMQACWKEDIEKAKHKSIVAAALLLRWYKQISEK